MEGILCNTLIQGNFVQLLFSHIFTHFNFCTGIDNIMGKLPLKWK